MKIKEIVNELYLLVYTGEEHLEKEIRGAYVSDLLSDVMGHAREGQAWITLQSHLNVVAIASLKELPAIILVKGLEAPAEVLEKAKEEGIVILGTGDNTFETAGKLYAILN
jgi:serine kinase of HPr protein (carbohydrate metabolism regulator)